MPAQMYARCPWCAAVTLQAVCPPRHQPTDIAARRYWCERCLLFVLHAIPADAA